MRVATEFPYEITEDERVWIPVSDGTRLSARIWRPVGSGDRPVPAILEYIPYRKRDLTAERDAVHHPYLAGHGYGCVRVDLRGTGESGGVLSDEYLEQEQQDALDVLAWIAAQPWCDGRTGMLGISWGGFAALQVAARRPPSLRAIAISSFTDDRYGDDMHYMGGCLLSDNLAEASTMFAYSNLPPDPALVGERWREMWLDRLRGSGSWLSNWLTHQRRDDYWRHASVSEDYTAVTCPVLATSGWADGYSNAVFRVLEHLDVPRRGLVGPWSHKYPHLGEPGPAIGYLQFLVRWWDHWLKDRDNGVLDGPMLTAWMQDSVPPSTAYETRPGRWVAEPAWPSPHVRTVELPLSPHRLGADADARGEQRTVSSPLSVGQFAGKWASYNAPPDLPYDQREEDGGSLTFDTAPLTERCEILGSPVAELEVSTDRPVAMIAARLSDLDEDGRATRVTYGLLNLTHRDSHDDPTPVEPGRRYRVRVPLNGVAQAFPAGHRIRLSLSTSYWPLAWPPPENTRLTVHLGRSTLKLPVRGSDQAEEPTVPEFGPPEGAAPLPTTQLTPNEFRWDISRDLIGYGNELRVVKDDGAVRLNDIDLTLHRRVVEEYRCVADDVTSAEGDVRWTVTFSRDDWTATAATRLRLRCSATDFWLQAELDAYDGDTRVYSRNWSATIPRDCL